MDKKVIWFIVILAVVVIFFSSWIIIMEKLTPKTSGLISSEETEVKSVTSGSSGKAEYDVFKPEKSQDKKADFIFAPSLEQKFTGKEPILDI